MTRGDSELKPATCRRCWRLKHYTQAAAPGRDKWRNIDCYCDAMAWIPDEVGLDTEHWCLYVVPAG